MSDPFELIRAADTVIWDFDGVIKESVQAKTSAFAALFRPFGVEVETRVVAHHRSNSGVSRFEKIPLYLGWAGQAINDEVVDAYCRKFAEFAVDAVIAAPWVPGAKEYLQANPNGQRFAVVSATPQDEIAAIVTAVGLGSVFADVHGSPRSKRHAVGMVIAVNGVAPYRTVMIGDAVADQQAAAANDVPFVLRRTPENVELSLAEYGLTLEDFMGLM